MAGPIRQELEQVYWEHRQGLYTLALSITRCPSRTEDAVQDAFSRLWRTSKAPRGELVPYVFAAVRNASIDQMRRNPSMMQSTEQTYIFDGQQDQVAGPLAMAVDLERQEIVRQAVEELPEEQRQAVVLHVYAGLTFEQVATMLQEPLPTVASRYRRALERLKTSMRKLV